ncbi:hypothetical protein [Thalassococcus sp. S3]|uniref:hypothetical protein n=1 Tax=Thalassococcus sp. S3 TaxID=2017482 RepID=UPI00102431D0|nr:hypothetical protein [Thalassococcus sp. S3]QBF33273.1 hypothetical protein CFI11_18885 [Thalassococcus sp. S3]
MDDYSTAHVRDIQTGGSTGGLLVAIVAVLVLLGGIIAMGILSGDDGTTAPAADAPAATAPATDPAPVVTE